MLTIALQSTPNQSFTIVEDGNIYRIHIYAVSNSLMCCDININSTDVYLGGRCIQGDFLIPWPSMEAGGGNFMFLDDKEADPWWENFGTTARLFYIPKSELVR